MRMQLQSSSAAQRTLDLHQSRRSPLMLRTVWAHRQYYAIRLIDCCGETHVERYEQDKHINSHARPTHTVCRHNF